ncbi:helix-turn-helix domain-containing protein [Flavobacterium rhizosphaerae]|uniref:Helix-turn-helix transcriptional regulator n=1 Tax=Flavobacterium rhizosphaerae TaxID=3163298 RepID=A0ABW8YWY6_9FLAO
MMATLPVHLKTIKDFHRFSKLPAPQHPLVSVIDYSTIPFDPENNAVTRVMDFYSITLKSDFTAKIKYGLRDCDFDDGTMFFMAPGQVFSVDTEKNVKTRKSGWILLIHPDFLHGTTLAKEIKRYEYFDYSVFEALFLSEKEKLAITGIMHAIHHEAAQNIDAFSQNIIISHIELLLSYAERFYHRQFITRKTINHQILDQLEIVLNGYFNDEKLIDKGLPTVQYVADSLNLTPNYLSGVLKSLTGRSTQQHLHDRLIEKAKEQLAGTTLSVSQIAYSLGFEHPQSFTKLFKAKTNFSPLAFRQSFN